MQVTEMLFFFFFGVDWQLWYVWANYFKGYDMVCKRCVFSCVRVKTYLMRKIFGGL